MKIVASPKIKVLNCLINQIEKLTFIKTLPQEIGAFNK